MLALRTTQTLDSLFEAFDRPDVPGVVVGVSYRGSVAYRRGFGMASLEHGVANTPATRMRIGSTTKHFCCLGILLLEEEGKLDIGRSVNAYLPDLEPPCGEPTLLQLMHHTGGLHDTLLATFLIDGGFHTQIPPGGTMQLLRRMRSRSFAPGTRMAYSNVGYTLLTQVIEKVSGLSWNDFMTQRVFAPLGMRDTMLAPHDLNIVPGLATPHVPQADGSWQRGVHPEELLGSGGMISTVDDLLLWSAHLRSPTKQVGSQASWARMLEPQTFAGAVTNGYGLGLMIERIRGVPVVHHAGATIGTQSQMLCAPEHALDVVVLANRMDASAPTLARKILEAVLEHDGLGPEVLAPAAAEHRALHGRWFSRGSRTLMSVEAAKGPPHSEELLNASTYNGAAGPLLRSGSGLARPEGPGSPVEIRRLPQGDESVDTLEVHICGEPERFERLPGCPPTSEQLAASWCGRYRYAEFGKEVEIAITDGKLVLDLLPASGRAQWELEPLADDVVGCGTMHSVPAFAVPLRGVLTLDRSDAKVRGFWLDTDRMRNVRFDRC